MHHSATSLRIVAEARQQELLADAARHRRTPPGGPNRRAGPSPIARCRAGVGSLLIRAGQTLIGGSAPIAETASAGR